jgi:hypothetical protein
MANNTMSRMNDFKNVFHNSLSFIYEDSCADDKNVKQLDAY